MLPPCPGNSYSIFCLYEFVLQKRDIYLEGRRRHLLRKWDRYLGRTLGWSQGAAFFFVPWQLSYLTRPFLHPFLIRMVAEKWTCHKWPQIFGGRYSYRGTDSLVRMTSKFHIPFLSCVLTFNSQKTSGNGSWLYPWGSTFWQRVVEGDQE